MKKLIFGGAFNPPTKAHIECARHAMEAVGFDRVVFVPSQKAYIRNDQGKEFAFDDRQRLDMLRKIAENREWMEVSDYEMTVEKQPRTYRTMQALNKEGDQLKLLMGSDKLPELEHGWMYVDELMRQFGIVVMSREHEDCEAMILGDAFLAGYKDCITVVNSPDTFQEVSSTKVRRCMFEAARQLRMLEEMVPRELGGMRAYLLEQGEEQ